MSMVLQSKVGGDFKPHPEGIYAAVCVDVIDLGLVESEWQGQKKLVRKVRLVFETEQVGEDGKRCIVTKTFTASVHPQAKLSDFLGKWRGRLVVPGESIDLGKLIGACCTLVISHRQNLVGRTFASIDAVSKPTKRVAPSGQYDPVLARQRIEEWKARGGGVAGGPGGGVRNGNGTAAPLNPVASAFPQGGATAPAASKSGAEAPQSKTPEGAGPCRTGHQEFDPEVGF